ncbi:MAG: zf-HC2 domain-containing protein [Myxococcota bacterium]|nr:zf-HC2 domain-containing protein [Myxococcota bacterium]
MRHGRARRLLPALLDRSLLPQVEAKVRAHADRCRRCSRALAELEAVDDLLGRLPATLVPLEACDEADSRLAALARWANPPALTWTERGLSALGAAAATAVFVGLLELGSLGQWVEPTSTPVELAASLPEASLFPTGVR